MKKSFLGIDIGSISIAFTEIDHNKNIINSAYILHKGEIVNQLSQILKNYDFNKIENITATASSHNFLKNISTVDDRVAFITAAQNLHEKAYPILIIGGEKFGLITFNNNGDYQNYRSNSSCAAGTGSFLDQQAKRLNIKNISEFSKLALNNKGEIPKIASRCAVFAKTDLIHAQQEGYTLDEICDGLSYGLAKNVCDTLFNGEYPDSPILLIGGVSQNQAVREHITQLTDCLIVDDKYSALYGAVGAAITGIKEQKLNKKNYKEYTDILKDKTSEKKYFYKPLKPNQAAYPDFSSHSSYSYYPKENDFNLPVEVDIYQKLSLTDSYKIYLGIDIGSTSTKAIIIDKDKNVLAGFYTRTSGQPLKAVQAIYETIDKLRKENNINFTFQGIGTTGSGRKFIGKIIKGDMILDEISAHARAAVHLDPQVDTIIEIGGQDSKFTTLKNGLVNFSIMNNVCAAGTGSFIEEQAQKLNCLLSDYSDRTMNQAAPLSSDRCTVFMERDLNHYLRNGYTVNQALTSVLHSVRENYLTKVAVKNSIGNKIFFQGATAKNQALVAAFEQKLKKPIIVSKYCHLTGALGVALEMRDHKIKKTGSIGLDLYKKKISLYNEICSICNNNCKIKIAEVNKEKLAFGFLCGRDYQIKKFINQNKSGFDLLAVRKKHFHFKKSANYKTTKKIGLPAALHLFDDLYFWEYFFKELKIETINSIDYKDGVKDGKKISGAEFCAPLTALHGHVSYLADKCDFIFLPVYLEKKQKNKNIRRQYCYYTQYASPLIYNSSNIIKSERIISPLIYSLKNTYTTRLELFMQLKKNICQEINFLQVSSAFDKALKFKNKAIKKLQHKASHLLNSKEIKVLLLGRPYTILNNSMNKNIINIFQKSGIKTIFQDMLAYDNSKIKNIAPLLKAFHWHYAANILEAAEISAKQKGLYPVLVTSFKCTPDSFVINYFKKIMEAYDKPYLILQLDDHDSNVGYETRIEAGVRAFKNHFSTEQLVLYTDPISANPDVTYDKKILRNKTILMPCWDQINLRLVHAQLTGEGYDIRVLEESPSSIQQSLQHNNGQCIPLNIIAQNAMDYIKKYKLDPGNTVLWMFDSTISCNIRMYPYYLKHIFENIGQGFEKIPVYIGEITFKDFSMKTAINIYFAYMFGGMVRKMGCKLRPYEKKAGSTNQAIKKSIEILYETLKENRSKEKTLERIIKLFNDIKIKKTKKPKVAVFGDLYVRDNDIMNQDLINYIEQNGGEVITTPYNEYLKIIADPYIKKWFNEGNYLSAAQAKILQKTLHVLEKKYYKYFNQILKEKPYNNKLTPEKVLKKLGVRIEHTGESMDNILKIFSIVDKHPDLNLLIQTNPSYCCPSLITEAMTKKIEELTGVPVVTIEYDGTGGNKNEDIIPYLKFPRADKKFHLNTAG